MTLLPRPAALFLAYVLLGGFLIFLASGCELSRGQGVAVLTLDDPPETDGALTESVGEEGSAAEARPAGLTLHLPTSNSALLRGDEGAFYSPLDKERIPGLRRFGWEGGRYGFVRNEARTPAGPTFTRLHQGVDIRPLYRDRQGEPLDTVRAIAPGTVVYANRGAGNSSYGRYVVVRHDWDGSPVYSLYAHLESVRVGPGTDVAAGEPLGRMGYTGTGINRARAHLHLEIAFLMNANFQRWHEASGAGRNLHGLFNGRNMRGVDVAGLYLALQEDPYLTFQEFILRQPVAYRLAMPGDRPIDFLSRYPWLATDGQTDADGAGAWVVGFTREGVPVEVTRQATPVDQPRVVFVAPEVSRRHLSTGGFLARSPDGSYRLTRSGLDYVSLLTTTSRTVPRWS